jgi:hypothetical protein
MAVESISREIERAPTRREIWRSRHGAGPAARPHPSGLADLIAGIDPDDPDLAEVVVPTEEYADQLVTSPTLTRGSLVRRRCCTPTSPASPAPR